MVNIKNEVLVRAYIVLILMVLAAGMIFTKAVRIGIVEGKDWRAKGDSLYLDYRPVDAQRGNILAADGSFLATSLPFFEIRMDLKSTGMSNEDFNKHVDSLAWYLSKYVSPSISPERMKLRLRQERSQGNRYFLIKNRASYEELDMMKKFPLFNKGRYGGGFIAIQRSERCRPFGHLAQRTIGYVREGAKPVGLEGKYDVVLSGKQGKQLMLRVSHDAWMPLNDLTDIEPEEGDDIKTTIDVNMQDITQQALLNAMQYHNAEKGCAIVMDVKTGAIKAMANLGSTGNGYLENYNYAVGGPIEPGSTFKLASIMALIEDGYIRLSDSIDLENGVTKYYGQEMRDAHPHHENTVTIREAFEISSNVGISKLIWKYYGEKERAGDFIEKLREFHLDQPVNIEIEGEQAPYIKEAYSKEDNWSGTTLPWMSTGYELTMTPLQILNFYNAVANDGTMMKPYLVSEIQRFGETVERIRPQVIKRRIASRRTIEKARELLEGVVTSGTAKLLQTGNYSFAGKTGTAQLNYQKLKSRNTIGGYQASFVGYFPAEDPLFSCIVVISNPKNYGIYGSEVAGPVFREIADKIYASRHELHEDIADQPRPVLARREMPEFSAGYSSEIEELLSELKIKCYEKQEKDSWVVLLAENDSLKMKPRTVDEKIIPSVVGMGLRDAVFLLENMGLKVQVSGFGKVKRQSVLPGTSARKQTVKLFLS